MTGILEFFPRRTVMAMVAGFVGAIMLMSGYYLTEEIWNPLVGFNSFLILVKITQVLFLGLLILIFTGSLAVSLVGSSSGKMKESLVAGLIAGGLTGIMVWSVILVARVDSAETPVVLLLRLIFLILLITMPGSALGAFAFHRSHSAVNAEPDTRIPENQLIYTLPALLVLILVCLVIPPALSISGTYAGLIRNDCLECRYHQDAWVERQQDGSLLITYTAKNSATMWVGRYTPAQILIGGIDVSNQTAIEVSGLSLSILPESGLSYSYQSSVRIRGAGTAGPGVNPAVVTVISYFGSGREPRVLFNESI